LDFYSLFLIALALSLDAFGVAICIGLNNQVKRKNKVYFAFSFGFFQFLCSITGAYAGFLFNMYIAAVPKVIGGIVIALVGILMIKEGLENKGECPLIKTSMYFVLGCPAQPPCRVSILHPMSYSKKKWNGFLPNVGW
jgi:putative Mn2+ efflux pump MntP